MTKRKKDTFFNLKNTKCQEHFKEAKTNNNEYLSKVLDEIKDLDTATNQFLKRLNKTHYKCFQRIGSRNNKPINRREILYNRWKNIKNNKDSQSITETTQIEEELAEEYFQKMRPHKTLNVMKME